MAKSSSSTSSTAKADLGFTSEDRLVSGNLLANDSGSNPRLTSAGTTSKLGAAITWKADGTYTYDPAKSEALQGLSPREYLVDTFTYTITYGSGKTAKTSTTTATIVVWGVNDAPATGAANEDKIGTEDVEVTGTLLAGTDVDGDTLTFKAGAGAAVGGSVAIDPNSGVYTFTPDADFNGTASFTYVVNDGTVDSAEKTVTITVLNVNDAPTGGVTISGTATEGEPLTASNTLGRRGRAWAR